MMEQVRNLNDEIDILRCSSNVVDLSKVEGDEALKERIKQLERELIAAKRE